MRRLVFVLLLGCGVSGPSSVTAPDAAAFSAAQSGATGITVDGEAETLVIDLDACRHERLHWWLPLGSAWFLVHPVSGAYCDIWLGGETENPQYDGSPRQYCRFDRQGDLDIQPQQGGPIVLDDMPWCTLL